ncbi:MAG: hypothetical protein JXA54_15570 [Candidatus Heimdallarchaeota archaeon]|nr:hypothetical protein [Candidatus Heimdallarchaeota archaeon]
MIKFLLNLLPNNISPPDWPAYLPLLIGFLGVLLASSAIILIISWIKKGSKIKE